MPRRKKTSSPLYCVPVICLLGGMMVLLTGCVSTQLVQTMVDDIQTLKSEQAALKKQVKELEVTVTDLTDRLETLQIDRSSDKAAQPEVSEPAVIPEADSARELAPPDTPSAATLYERGLISYRKGEYRAATANLEQAALISEDPSLQSRAFFLMGECFYNQKSFTRAIDYYGRVADNYTGFPEAVDALLKIGFTYYELHEYNKAEQLLKEFLSGHPDHRDAERVRERLSEIEKLLVEAQADSTKK